ncbi:hypothetical protein IM720_24565 [Pseudomonas fluorescens]|uniref:Uncharacterized protein n=1 Tax=Pseudomonas fluorescens TaxID=294 RepID=A0A7M2J2H1_PSEFL|nr:hypothetical protein [Pseudomonas fluorescens]QOU03847.1 hypothetical protein IM720_24565 [Pseudomonas fluorescens]
MKYIVALVFLSLSQMVQADCSVPDIKITSVKAQFINTCGSADCTHMAGVATLVNSCAEATGVQIQITAYDKLDSPVSTSERWPASIRNIPPGSYTFSLNQWLEYDPTITSFGLKVIDVNKWKK